MLTRQIDPHFHAFFFTTHTVATFQLPAKHIPTTTLQDLVQLLSRRGVTVDAAQVRPPSLHLQAPYESTHICRLLYWVFGHDSLLNYFLWATFWGGSFMDAFRDAIRVLFVCLLVLGSHLDFILSWLFALFFCKIWLIAEVDWTDSGADLRKSAKMVYLKNTEWLYVKGVQGFKGSTGYAGYGEGN